MKAEEKSFSFTHLPPKEWLGRYRITKGVQSVFHIIKDEEFGLWPFIYQEQQNNTVYCPAIYDDAIENLVDAVNASKSRRGSLGGSFIINEFGQVIVPSSDGNNRELVGEISGRLLFEDPISGDEIDIWDDVGLTPNTLWNKPYIGMVYNYEPRKGIHFKAGNRDIQCERQDPKLGKQLFLIRDGAYIRFIVNPGGIVLTKIPGKTYNGPWQPVYVGRLDYSMWFTKQE